LQAPSKKRTDRRYLSTAAQVPADAPSDAELDEVTEEAASPEAALESEPIAAAVTPTPARAEVTNARTTPSRLPTAVRAMQQQGVRKKRDLDPRELAERDTKYALHELRRIAVLAVLIIATLIVLGVVMR
jgi:hypothetical protein